MNELLQSMSELDINCKVLVLNPYIINDVFEWSIFKNHTSFYIYSRKSGESRDGFRNLGIDNFKNLLCVHMMCNLFI
jgi:hypothetical protein